MHNHLDRNLIGYGANPPDPQWPGDARIAVSFVLNYEEGGENTDPQRRRRSEVFLTETPGGTPLGRRARPLDRVDVRVRQPAPASGASCGCSPSATCSFTSWAVGRALELNPAAGKAMAEAGHEVASHGWRWINYKDFTLEQELDHMTKTVKAIDRHRRQAAGRLVHRPLRHAHARRPSSSMAASSIRATPTPTTCPTG